MADEQGIGVWYKYTHLPIFINLVLLCIPIYHITKHTFFNNWHICKTKWCRTCYRLYLQKQSLQKQNNNNTNTNTNSHLFPARVRKQFTLNSMRRIVSTSADTATGTDTRRIPRPPLSVSLAIKRDADPEPTTPEPPLQSTIASTGTLAADTDTDTETQTQMAVHNPEEDNHHNDNDGGSPHNYHHNLALTQTQTHAHAYQSQASVEVYSTTNKVESTQTQAHTHDQSSEHNTNHKNTARSSSSAGKSRAAPALKLKQSHSRANLNTGGAVAAKKRKTLPLSSKIVLFFAMAFSAVYLLSNTIEAAFMWIDRGYAPALCEFVHATNISAYAFSRVMTTLYFVLQCKHAFHGSFLAVSRYYLILLYVICVSVGFFASIPSMYFFIRVIEPTFTTDESGHGMHCTTIANYARIGSFLRTVFVAAGLMDMLYSCLSLYIIVSKLFKLIFSMQRRRSSVASKQSQRKANEFLKLICKLVFLSLIAVFSSYFGVLCLLFARHYTDPIYTTDAVINVYCIWLSFNYTKKLYYHTCCGNCLLRCGFPFLKCFAYTCPETIECCCYCCVFCCNRVERRTQIDIYRRAKVEIAELLSMAQEH